MRYKAEADLLDHYNSNPTYYSPLNSKAGVDKFLAKFNVVRTQPLDVLDIGCGDGRLARYWPEARVTGVDISPVRIDIASKLPGTWICGDLYDTIEELEATGRVFDVGIAVEVLEHLANPAWVVKKLRGMCYHLIATLPVNMPYFAHLQVFESKDQVQDMFDPMWIEQDGQHFYCEWENEIPS